MAQIYRIKEGSEWMALQPLGYEVYETSPISFRKVVPQDLNGELCQGRIENIYNNHDWQKQIYSQHKKKISKTLGLRFRKSKVVMTDRLASILTSWEIYIDMSDGWIGFTSGDPFDQRVYYATVHLDKYCADEIKALKDADLIEVIEVEENSNEG